MILEIAQTIRKYGLLLCMFLATGMVLGQQTSVEKVKAYALSAGKDMEALKELQQQPPKEVAAAIWQFANDTTTRDLEYLVNLIRLLEKKHTDIEVRSTYVRTLMECALKHRSTHAVPALMAMRAFEKNCFEEAVTDDLRLLISMRSQGRSEAIRLLGFAGAASDIEFLKGLGLFTTLSKQEKYAVQLALARLGGEPAAEMLLTGLREKRFNDDVVTNILPDLIYTHHSKIYGQLLQELLNNTPACHSANNDSDEKVLCAYRILEQISNHIVGFPVKATAYGELEGEYEAALFAARSWILSVNTAYSIDNTHF